MSSPMRSGANPPGWKPVLVHIEHPQSLHPQTRNYTCDRLRIFNVHTAKEIHVIMLYNQPNCWKVCYKRLYHNVSVICTPYGVNSVKLNTVKKWVLDNLPAQWGARAQWPSRSFMPISHCDKMLEHINDMNVQTVMRRNTLGYQLDITSAT